MLSLPTRRIIAISFIVAFLIIAPILILYTSGYRYSFKKQQISKTGSLVIETDPRNATVTLNNEEPSHQTPLRLTDLFPNEYLIKVEKEGYYPWQKTLPIYSQQTTFAEDIILFKKSQPAKILSDQLDQPQLSPDKKSLIYLINNGRTIQIKWLKLSGDNPQLILEFETANFALVNINWSKNSDHLLVLLNDLQTQIITPKIISLANLEAKPINSPLLTQTPLNIIKWSSAEHQTLYTLTANKISQLTINPELSGTPEPITASQIFTFAPEQTITDFLIHQDQIYFVEQKDQSIILSKKSLEENNPTGLYPQIELNQTNNYSIEGIIDNKIVMKELDHNKIYLINLELNNVLLERQDILGYSHSQAANQLLIFDDSEIMTADMSSYPFTIETIARFSAGVTYAEWYPEPNYVLFVKDGQINLIELDKRDIKNITTLPPTNVIFADLDAKGENIYYATSDKPGLFELNIFD
jgi:hypothetical protein